MIEAASAAAAGWAAPIPVHTPRRAGGVSTTVWTRGRERSPMQRSIPSNDQNVGALPKLDDVGRPPHEQPGGDRYAST
jgi:hypothetical protein